MTVTFFVPGKPEGKARPRFTREGHAYTPEATRNYEKKVYTAWKSQCAKPFGPGVPLKVYIEAAFPIPQRASKKRHDALIGKPYTHKVDADNVAKAVLDAIQPHAFPDDAAVATLVVKKLYAEEPGVFVSIQDIGAHE